MPSSLLPLSLTLILFSPLLSDCGGGTDEYCGQCGTNGSCLVCYNSFKKERTCSAVTSTVTNCQLYSDENTCISCAPGYYLTHFFNSQVCLEINIYDCYAVNPQTVKTCWHCDGFELLSTGLCDNSKPCTQENCRSCESQNGSQVCTLCQDGYVVSNAKTCVAATGTLEGCTEVDADNNCVGCRFGYYVDSETNQTLQCKKSSLYEGAESLKISLIGFLVLGVMKF